MNRNAWKKRYKRAYPSVKDYQLVNKIADKIKEELMPHLAKFFKDFEIHYTTHREFLGIYITCSYKKPIVLLNIDGINKSCKKYRVDKYCGIETTIVHELGHAIEDYYDLCANEEEVEEFANIWYWDRELYKFWDGFESPENFPRIVVAEAK